MHIAYTPPWTSGHVLTKDFIHPDITKISQVSSNSVLSSHTIIYIGGGAGGGGDFLRGERYLQDLTLVSRGFLACLIQKV